MALAVVSAIRRGVSGVFVRGTSRQSSDESSEQDVEMSHVFPRKPFNRSNTSSGPYKQFRRPYRRPGKLWFALRAIGLHFFSNLNRQPEVVKAAVHQSRTVAAIRCLVHILPFSGASILLYMNFSSYYVGQITPNVIAALQFAAKTLELSMIASIITIFLNYLRYDLISEQGLPFGVAFAGLQIYQVTYLWSPDFWGAITSSHFSLWYRARIALLVLVATVMIAIIGPASAACMIPRAVEYPIYAADVGINATADRLFPTNLSTSLYNTNLSCQTHYIQSQPAIVEPCSLANSSANVVSLATVSMHSQPLAGSKNVDSTPWITLAPSYAFGLLEYVPTSLTMYVTYPPPHQYGGIVSTSTQPLGLAQLLMSYGSDIDVTPAYDAYCFARYWSSAVHWSNLSTQPPELPFAGVNYGANTWLTNAASQEILDSARKVANGSLQYFNYFYTADTKSDENTTTLVMATIWSQYYDYTDANMQNYNLSQGIYLVPYEIKLGWVPTTWKIRGLNLASTAASWEPPRDTLPVTMTDGWFESVMASLVEGTNLTSFDVMLGDYAEMGPGSAADYCLSLLSMLFTASLSNMNPVLDEKDFVIGSYINESSYLTIYKGMQYESGYGYGIDAITVRLSLSILIIFCLLVLSHCGHLIWSGVSSAAWDSVSEIAVLCLNSRQAPEANNACAGIQSAHMFRFPVRVASTHGEAQHSALRAAFNPNQPVVYDETNADHLEILFPSGKGAAVGRVIPNMPYGRTKLKDG